MRLRALIAGAVLLLGATAAAAQQVPAAALAGAVAERLQLMEGVARYKWNLQIPIEDLAREAVVLQNVVAAAEAEGVAVDLATEFFRAQITAAKAIQSRLFAVWSDNRAGTFSNAADLNDELRPAINELTGEIIALLAGLNTIDAAELCTALSEVPSPLAEDAEAWAIAVTPLRQRLPGC